MAEQNFSNSDRVDPASAAKVGKLLGVDVIVVGSITQFGTEKKKFDVAGFGRRIWGDYGGGRVGTEQGKAKVAITARFIDVNTGEILASTTGVGESVRASALHTAYLLLRCLNLGALHTHTSGRTWALFEACRHVAVLVRKV